MANPILTVPETNYPVLLKRMGLARKRAGRLGVALPDFEIVDLQAEQRLACPWEGERDLIHEHGPGCYRPVVFYVVEITGHRPAFKGWRFLGTIHREGGQSFAMNAPDSPGVPHHMLLQPSWCDHCRLDRKRGDTFAVVSEDGTVLQVGRNCLADFIEGGTGWLAYLEWLHDTAGLEQEPDNYHGRIVLTESLDYVLALACALTTHYGYGNRDAAYPTRARVQDYIDNRPAGRDGRTTRQIADPDGIVDTDMGAPERARLAREWAAALSLAAPDAYLQTIRTVALLNEITYRLMGFAVSIPQAWERATTQQAERDAEEATRATSQHFGTVGARAEFTLTLTGEARPYDSDYGTSWLHTFLDGQGNRAVWWATSGPLAGVTVGQPLQVKATVKAHETDKRGGLVTKLTRLALVKANDKGDNPEGGTPE